MPLLAELAVIAAFVFTPHSDAPSIATVALAAEVGITPESLVVAGIAPAEGAVVVDNMGTDGESSAAIAAAHASVDAQTAALRAAERALNESPGEATLIQARASAAAALASARSGLASLRAAVRTRFLVGLSQAKLDAVETFASSAGRVVAPEFRAISRTNAEWVALESALRAEARAMREGAALAAPQAELLSAARGNSAVIAAKARLNQDLPAMKALFTPQP